ncbi:ABC transporter ATP-binding protein [Meiothermus sp.]|uniref:ABC transporter ATP-binding protein n=1 Tax=Meiothermus sp. TaxID=1955249 RepID=UPI0021DC1225|nr:ABC transporter ATP-binding protein [Meiothermus sp.]GIW24042.1 MAG: Fe(3+) ions import ATP-binding protein FbpC [Meiothermus sp.]
MSLALEIEGLTKRFGETIAVDNLSLTVPAGQLLTLLGPSGCGKTTTLRMVAGLEIPDGGHIRLGTQDITELPAYRRGLGMVFQSYALFPHMSVFENVAYGLKNRGLAASEVARRVEAALQRVGLGGLGARPPHTLSGGQQQRVAVARALVLEPPLLLFDEPLSNLDAKLRRSVRTELRALQQELGITALYVTHDQEEALALSDLIAVMNAGRLQQLGTPEEVYRYPANPFVASFIGMSSTLEAQAEPREEGVWAHLGGVRLPAFAPTPFRGAALLVVRPEEVRLGQGELSGRVRHTSYLGERLEVQLETPWGLLLAYQEPPKRPLAGQEVPFHIGWAAAYPA